MTMSGFKVITEEKELSGKRVLVRFDFNVPVALGRIVDDFRLKRALPTMKYLSEAGARIIAISHIEGEGSDTLKLVFDYFEDKFRIKFANSIETAKGMIEQIEDGEILLVENLRKDSREKENSEDFTKEIASLGDVYVNEAFSVSHREHASIVGVPKLLPSYAGLLFEEEISNLSKALSPEHPFLFALGGAKFKTKLPLIEKYIEIADNLFIAGALANDFFKCQGYEIGRSKISGEDCDISKLAIHNKIILPSDVLVTDENGKIITKKPDEVLNSDLIEDSGPATLKLLESFIKEAKLIIWNGPLGNYEKGFREKTVELARMISESEAFSIVGGGDTIAVIRELDIENKFDFVSTAGGAMLQFLQEGTLPGIEAIKLKAEREKLKE